MEMASLAPRRARFCGRLAMASAVLALIATGLASPGHFWALGLAILAVGTGWVAYHQAGLLGGERLVAAAAIAVGGLAAVLASVRVAMILVAIDHLSRFTT